MLELRIPLLNAQCLEPVDYGRSISVRPANRLELDEWLNDPFVRDVVPHRLLPEIDTVLVHRGCTSYDPEDDAAVEVDEALTCWFGLASLFAGRAVEAAFSEQWFHVGDSAGERDQSLGGPRYLSFSLPVSQAPAWNGRISLTESAQWVRDALPAFGTSHRYVGEFRFALARWFYSLNKHRRTLEDAVVDLSIALESLFVLDSEREGLERLMQERIARFWQAGEGSETELRGMMKRVRLAYDVRSRIVHGFIVDGAKLREAHNVLNQITRELLLDFVTGKLETFDPQTLWTPPRRDQCLGRICVGVSCKIPPG